MKTIRFKLSHEATRVALIKAAEGMAEEIARTNKAGELEFLGVVSELEEGTVVLTESQWRIFTEIVKEAFT